VNRGCLLAIAFVVAFWIAVALFVASAFAAPRSASVPSFPVADQGLNGASHGTSQLLPRVTVALDAAVAGAGAEDRSPASDAPLTGNAGWAVPSLGALYLAVRLPRGTVVTVCGPGACWTTRTTDYGPSSRIKPSRVVDIAVGHWREVCGLSPSRGLCRVTIVRTPMAPATDFEEGS